MSEKSAPTPTTASTPPTRRGQVDRGKLLMVLALPVILIVSLLIGGVIFQQSRSGPQPLAVSTFPAPAAADPACTSLLSALPQSLAGHERRELTAPVDGVAAWGDPALVLRCGLPTPAELNCAAALTVLSTTNGQPGVQWLQLSSTGQTTYLAADRRVRIALTLPDGVGTGPIQELSSVISGVMPTTAQPDGKLCKDGVLPPVVDQ